MLRGVLTLSIVLIVAVAAIVGGASENGASTTSTTSVTSTGTTCNSSQMSTTTQSSEAKTFSFPVERGQYIFLGEETGTASKKEWERGVRPVWRAYIDPKAVSQKWEMEITVQPAVREKGQSPEKPGRVVWKWEVTWLKSDAHGVMRRSNWMPRRSEVSDVREVEKMEVEKVDASEKTAVKGLVLYRIAYAKVDGDTQCIVVAIADKKEAFPKAITVAKSFILFDWEDWVPLQ